MRKALVHVACRRPMVASGRKVAPEAQPLCGTRDFRFGSDRFGRHGGALCDYFADFQFVICWFFTFALDTPVFLFLALPVCDCCLWFSST